MRLGQNPAKYIDTVAQPADVTVAVVNCIPFLSGYHAQSLEVLKVCLSSLRENTDRPFDLLLFDNHSCREVRDYLLGAYEQGLIQYLVLSDTNIGKIGAWNFMLSAAQGQHVCFTDSDIYFRPGWLSASLELFDAFPNVGMVTGRPVRTDMGLSTSTLDWARKAKVRIEEENFVDWKTYLEHEGSLGNPEADERERYETGRDSRLSSRGVRAYVGASHFQFVVPKRVLAQVVPLSSEKPLRNANIMDSQVNRLGYLRLCTEQALVLHMGNRVPDSIRPSRPLRRQHRFWKKILWNKAVRYVLLGAYSNIFRWYFENVE